ncbi:MAG: hypothetical protein JNJ82_03940 [Opitutaceae bacterium]|nr:hypothetical protein [Opitutaceae bacterium]
MPAALEPRSPLLLGIDVGSTVVKAVLFDGRGRKVAAAEATVPVVRPQPGWVERDAEATWEAAAAVLRRAVRGRAARIAAVGVTGCGNGAVFVDRRGRPLRAGILSSDTRAVRFLRLVDTPLGQRAYAGQLPVLLAWLRACEPALARRLGCAVFWKDFIRTRLTGLICSDFTDAGAAGLLDFPSRRLRSTGANLPPLQESFASAGAVTAEASARTDLRTGTPVFTGCIDCEAAALGCGVHAPGEVSVVAGTWSINQVYVNRPPRRGGHFLVNPSVEPGRWLVLEGSPSSMANFDWACRLLAEGADARKTVAAAIRAPRSRLIFLPQVPTGCGALLGLDSGHDRGVLLRAVMEGIVFAHRSHLDRLKSTVGRIRSVRLAGGAAQNPAWCQLFADGLGCLVEVSRGGQPGALGAALCAGVGAGLWPSVTTAQRELVPLKMSYMSDPQRQAEMESDYRRYRTYSQIFSR